MKRRIATYPGADATRPQSAVGFPREPEAGLRRVESMPKAYGERRGTCLNPLTETGFPSPTARGPTSMDRTRLETGTATGADRIGSRRLVRSGGTEGCVSSAARRDASIDLNIGGSGSTNPGSPRTGGIATRSIPYRDASELREHRGAAQDLTLPNEQDVETPAP